MTKQGSMQWALIENSPLLAFLAIDILVTVFPAVNLENTPDDLLEALEDLALECEYCGEAFLPGTPWHSTDSEKYCCASCQDGAESEDDDDEGDELPDDDDD